MTDDSEALIVATYLISLGGGLFTDGNTMPKGAWPLFVNFLPDSDDTPDDAACLYDTTGTDDGRIQAAGGEVVDHPGLELKVRAVNFNDARKKVKAADAAMSAVNRATVVLGAITYRIHSLRRQGTPLSNGVERQGRRHVYTVNYLATIDVA